MGIPSGSGTFKKRYHEESIPSSGNVKTLRHGNIFFNQLHIVIYYFAYSFQSWLIWFSEKMKKYVEGSIGHLNLWLLIQFGAEV